MTIKTCLSFIGHSAHRDVHSFPTRRSSDLGAAHLVGVDAGGRRIHGGAHRATPLRERDHLAEVCWSGIVCAWTFLGELVTRPRPCANTAGPTYVVGDRCWGANLSEC